MRRLVPFLILLGASCGKQRASTPVPQSPNTAISQFMDAVKANDLGRMGNLWGSTQGPAVTFWDRDRLRQHLATMQKYLDHTGYRIIEGPLPAQPLNPTFKNVPSPDRLRDFRVELQRTGCNVVFPMTVVQTDSGGWLVYDVHLESVGTPGRCSPTGVGTRP
ncbi:MAG: hypothetical protein AUH78_16175 [Gemmatimonadetes bacterium 13_1_40CM_4_69_8]|nr:MAG: hypothetical protein AUH78_16175 [Gemmatimonadetes bacterium 13_1_40CM_4_69_8]